MKFSDSEAAEISTYEQRYGPAGTATSERAASVKDLSPRSTKETNRRYRALMRQIELDLAYQAGYEAARNDMELDGMFFAPIGSVFYALDKLK